MTEGRDIIVIIPLNAQNYGTWKVNVKMAEGFTVRHTTGHEGGAYSDSSFG